MLTSHFLFNITKEQTLIKGLIKMKFNNIVDNSMLNDFKKCPKYFQYRHLEYLAPLDEMSGFKTGYGSALHEGLETWYNGIKDNINPLDVDLCDSAVNSFKNYWNKYEGADVTGMRSALRGEMILRMYFKRFQNEDFKVLETEIGGSFQIGEGSDALMVIFKADMLCEDKDGEFVFETKTSGHRGFLTIKPNSQIDTYISGVRILKDKPINRALLNQLYFRKGRKGESLTKTFDFVRESTMRTDDELQQWEKDVLFYGNCIKKASIDNHYAKNTQSCTAYGGCMFQRLCCISDTDTRNSVKETLFRKEKWEPWEGARGIIDV